MDIGNRIKKCRNACNLSQEELADKVFVSRQTISNWENNKYYPDIKSISLLCNIFNVSLDDFISSDIEGMKKVIAEGEKKVFNVLAWIFTFELFVMIVSAYPLLKLTGLIGVCIWILFAIITFSTSLVIERLKKHYDIQTYKEILAFYENKPLSHDDKNKELGKRYYQKFLLALASGIIAIIVMMIMHYIFG